MAERKFQMKNALINHPEEACLIGNIIARWNVIERMMSGYLVYFMGADYWQARLVIDALMNSRARLDVIEAAGLYALHKSELESGFADLIKIARQRLSARNVYAHSVYAINEKGRLVAMETGFDWTDLGADKQTQKVSRPITVAALNKEHEAAKALYQSVSAFTSRLAETQPTLQSNLQVPPIAFLRRAAAMSPQDQNAQATNSRLADKED